MQKRTPCAPRSACALVSAACKQNGSEVQEEQLSRFPSRCLRFWFRSCNYKLTSAVNRIWVQRDEFSVFKSCIKKLGVTLWAVAKFNYDTVFNGTLQSKPWKCITTLLSLHSRRYFNRAVNLPAFNHLTPIQMHKSSPHTHPALFFTKEKCIYYSYMKVRSCQRKAQNIHLLQSDACTFLNATTQDMSTCN